jgi:hypothetical protein
MLDVLFDGVRSRFTLFFASYLSKKTGTTEAPGHDKLVVTVDFV